MKRLILVLNGKGGVGKSFFAVNLVQFLKDNGIPYAAIDTDNENSTLKRFHPEAAFLDLGEPRQLDDMFGALDSADLVVVDCRAASSDLFLDYFDEINLRSVLAELGTTLTVAIPINHEADSVDQVQRLADRLGRTCGYVVIRNASHSGSFALYESLEIRMKVTGELGGREIDMPRLGDWLVEALNREDLTVTAASKHASFSLLDRQRLLSWQRKVYSAIKSAGDLLLSVNNGGDHG